MFPTTLEGSPVPEADEITASVANEEVTTPAPPAAAAPKRTRCVNRKTGEVVDAPPSRPELPSEAEARSPARPPPSDTEQNSIDLRYEPDGTPKLYRTRR